MTSEILSVTTHDTADGVRVLAAAGDVDHDSVKVLRDAVETAWEDGRTRIVLDLTQVAFCDSGGLSLFVEAHRRTRTRGGSFHLAAPSRTVRYVLDATHLGAYLSIHPSVEDALRV